jgi:hypothetical protein
MTPAMTQTPLEGKSQFKIGFVLADSLSGGQGGARPAAPQGLFVREIAQESGFDLAERQPI